MGVVDLCVNKSEKTQMHYKLNLQKKDRFLIFIAVIFLLTSSFRTETSSLNFKDWSWSSVKDGSEMYHKPVMLFIYSDNCIQSNHTLAEFNTSRVSEFYNRSFICNRMNAEKLKHLLKAQTMGVKSVPTIVFFNTEGKIIHKVAGQQNRTQLLDLGTHALNLIKEEVAKKKEEVKQKNQNKKAEPVLKNITIKI